MAQNTAFHPNAPLNNPVARMRYLQAHIDNMNPAKTTLARDYINRQGMTPEEAVHRLDYEAVRAQDSVYLHQTGDCSSCGLQFDRTNGRQKLQAREKCDHILCESCVQLWWIRSPSKCRESGCSQMLEEKDWVTWQPTMSPPPQPLAEFLRFKNIVLVPLPGGRAAPAPVTTAAAASRPRADSEEENPLFVPEGPGSHENEEDGDDE